MSLLQIIMLMIIGSFIITVLLIERLLKVENISTDIRRKVSAYLLTLGVIVILLLALVLYQQSI